MRVELISLELIQLIITASLESKLEKLPTLQKARIDIELLKRLFTIIRDLNIIAESKYIKLESELQEISMMTNGWIKYLTAAH